MYLYEYDVHLVHSYVHRTLYIVHRTMLYEVHRNIALPCTHIRCTWYLYIVHSSLQIYIYTPPRLGHGVECLQRPCCPSAVLMLLLVDLDPCPETTIFNCVLFLVHFVTTTMLYKAKKQWKWFPTRSQISKSISSKQHKMFLKPTYSSWFGHIQRRLVHTLAINKLTHRHNSKFRFSSFGLVTQKFKTPKLVCQSPLAQFQAAHPLFVIFGRTFLGLWTGPGLGPRPFPFQILPGRLC